MSQTKYYPLKSMKPLKPPAVCLLNQDWSAEHAKYWLAVQLQFTTLDIIRSVGDKSLLII